MADNMNTIQMANRAGLDVLIYEFGKEKGTAKQVTIDYANSVSVNLSREIVWATGGQTAAKMIGFKDPYEGSISIETQVQTTELLNLLADEELNTETGTVTFKNDVTVAPKYYVIEGTTVYQDKAGTVYAEEIKAYKALVKPNYDVTYDGSGDPQSITVEFELAQDDDGNVFTITRKDKTSE